MADYKKALAKLLPKEGVYDNDPKDPGGETVWGITKRDHPNDPVWAIVNEMRGFPGFPGCLAASVNLDVAVQNHYLANYWNPVRGNDIADQGVAEELFDTAVNCGIQTAIGLLERVLNDGNRNGEDYPDVVADGKLDDTDLAHIAFLVAKRGSAAVVKALNIYQGARYRDICEKNGEMERFYWGWIINRA